MTAPESKWVAEAMREVKPGSDEHLQILMAPQHLQFLSSTDRADVLAYGRTVWQAALSSASSGAGVLPDADDAANLVTLDKRDLFDTVRAALMAGIRADESDEAQDWSTATDLAHEHLSKLYAAQSAILAATQRAEPVAQSGVEGLREVLEQIRVLAGSRGLSFTERASALRNIAEQADTALNATRPLRTPTSTSRCWWRTSPENLADRPWKSARHCALPDWVTTA